MKRPEREEQDFEEPNYEYPQYNWRTMTDRLVKPGEFISEFWWEGPD